MTKIKLCGLSQSCDIVAANKQKPDYIGFVFAPKSRRYVTYEKALELKRLRLLTDKPVIKAFRIETANDIEAATQSTADHILLDSGAGTGTVFDWNLLKRIKRPYFLAGGLDVLNVAEAVRTLHPFAVDVSSGIENGGVKDQTKMAAFTAAVRKEDRL